MISTPPKPDPHWRREVEPSEHNRAWLAVLAGVVLTFFLMEIPALGRAVLNDTASEAVWAFARPFGWQWWASMPPLWGLAGWVSVHFAFRWGGWLELLWCVLAAYAVALVIVLLLKG